MPIEHLKGGGIAITGPAAMELYRLISLRSCLKLQRDTGMRPNRHVNPLKIAKVLTKLKTNDYNKHLEAIDKLIEVQRTKVTHIIEADDVLGEPMNDQDPS